MGIVLQYRGIIPTLALTRDKKITKMKNNTYKIECPEDKNLIGILVPKQKLKSDHSRIFHDGVMELVLDGDLTGTDLRVFLGILANLEYENLFTMSLTALSAKLKIQRPDLSKAVSKLIKKNYLHKVGNQGQVNHYMVDPRIAFKARVSKFSQVLNRWDDLPQTQSQNY